MALNWKLRLIEDWRQAWRWFSMQAMAGAGSVQAAWLATPAELRNRLPGTLITVLTIVLVVAGIVGRLIDQPAKPKQP